MSLYEMLDQRSKDNLDKVAEQIHAEEFKQTYALVEVAQ